MTTAIKTAIGAVAMMATGASADQLTCVNTFQEMHEILTDEGEFAILIGKADRNSLGVVRDVLYVGNNRT